MIIPAAPRGRIPTEVLSVPGRPCRLRGGILSAHLSLFTEHAGAEALARLRDALPAPLRAHDLAHVRAEEWVPFELVVSVDRAIARLLTPGREEETWVALGRHSAKRTFGGSVPKAPSIHHHFWTGKLHHTEFGDFGTCTYVPLLAQALRMEYREYPVMSRVFCQSACGFFEGSIEVLGAHDPIVEESTCQCYGDPACTFVVSWEA